MIAADSSSQAPQPTNYGFNYGFNADTFSPASRLKPPQPAQPPQDEQEPYASAKKTPRATKGDGAAEPFFKMPGQLFGSGTAAKLGPFAGWLYTALREYRNRRGSRTFHVSDAALATETGISERSIRRIRQRLVELGLVTAERDSNGQSYTYTVLPQDWQWVKLADREDATAKTTKTRKPRMTMPAQTTTPTPAATTTPAPEAPAPGPKVVTMPAPAPAMPAQAAPTPAVRPMQCRHCRCTKMQEVETPGHYKCGVCWEITIKAV